ncbi:T9SS type A sorting domain-containing protein [Fodinibius halophilus]|uniref:T9SS type A sorting domain-containing protein n=1 Tax=Fodinibius halophilus TaxID=1736908 RepID=A0A6M1TM09_9BACT|nr:T9SS type A sorting domain-containing protein [Fodinibius halophilus]NGP89470.1 T9SS type A sorting domain-containing protein [Fodinibius halophilus]
MNAMYLKLSALFVIVLTFGIAGQSPGQTTTINSDTTDYDILYRSNGQQNSFHGASESLLVSIEDKSLVTEYYRAILEFDISELTAPVDQAVFHVYKEINSSGNDFDIDLYGSTENRSDFISSTVSSSKDEFFGSTHPYTLLGSSPFITPSDPNQEWYSIDITNFINNRISDYQANASDNIVILKIRPDGSYSGNGFSTSYYFGSGDNTSGKEPYLEITPGDITQTVSGNEGWRILSAPELNNSFGALTNDIWTQGFTGADNSAGTSNVYIWNEGNGSQDTTARGFTSINNASETLDNGKGFLVYVYEDDDPSTTAVDGGFPKTLDITGFAPSNTVSPNISLTKQGGTYVTNRDGWNLVGNPFGAKIDWDDNANWTKTNIDNTIYVWDSSANEGSGSYLTWNGSAGSLAGGEIGVWQGFWVKANNNGSPSLAISPEAIVSSDGGALYKNNKSISQIELKLTSNNQTQSSAFLSFNSESSLKKDIYDAYKLRPLNGKNNYLYFTGPEKTALEINAIPEQIEDIISFPLRYEINNSTSEPLLLEWEGQNIPGEIDLFLVDQKTGEHYNLKEHDRIHIQPVQQKKISNKKVTTASPDNPPVTPYPTVIHAKQKDPRFIVTAAPVTETNTKVPDQIRLQQNYPNPFNPETVIKYSVPSQSKVTLRVYDMLGREVRTLIDQQKSAGSYKANFNGRNLASGLYFYQLKVGTKVLTKKMSLVK